MKEEWKFVSMRHGAQFVITSIGMTGMSHKQILFVNSWDSLELVSNNMYSYTFYIMYYVYITQLSFHIIIASDS